MTELLPCPFCGGEAVLQKFNVSVPGRIICACGAEMRGYRGQPLSELIEAWNTRTERGECEFEWSLADNGWADHTCSNCGYTENTDVHVSLGWSFCPNCGAKVVNQ